MKCKNSLVYSPIDPEMSHNTTRGGCQPWSHRDANAQGRGAHQHAGGTSGDANRRLFEDHAESSCAFIWSQTRTLGFRNFFGHCSGVVFTRIRVLLFEPNSVVVLHGRA